MKPETVLEKVGISDKLVNNWKNEGLTITFPMKENRNYFKSADGEVVVENADKFVPHLTKKETLKYIKKPNRFCSDFKRNLLLYKKFCDQIFDVTRLALKLKGKDKPAALLSLLYLFQRGMDNHYYHWDRYLVYEEYPQTPVGYWWDAIERLYKKATKINFEKNKPPTDLLRLISQDVITMSEMKQKLTKKEYTKLIKALEALKTFQNMQQNEIKILSESKKPYAGKLDALMGTGLLIVDALWKELKSNPGFIKKDGQKTIYEILKMHPVIGARRLLLIENLNRLDPEISYMFKQEVDRWTV